MKRLIAGTLTLIILAATLIGCQSAHMTSAKVYLQQKQYGQALESLKREVEINPTNAEAYYMAGEILGEMDSLDAMLYMFNKAEELDSSYIAKAEKWRRSKSGTNYNKGIKEFEKDNIDEAIEYTRLAAKISPENVAAWKNLAFFAQAKVDMLVEKGGDAAEIKKYNEMKTNAYQEAFDANPDDDEIRWLLAGQYLDNEVPDPDKALELLVPIEGTTENTKILFTIAEAYDLKENSDKSFEVLTRAESIAPDDPLLLFDLGVRYYNLKNYEKAAEYFGKVADLQPDNIDALYNEGYALFYAEKKDEAEAVFIELVKKSPTNYEVWEQLGIMWTISKRAAKGKAANAVAEAIQASDWDKANAELGKLDMGITITPPTQ